MAKFRHTWSHYSRPKFLRISCQDDADTESARTADEQIDYLEGLEPCPCYAKCCLDSIITLFCVTLLGWNSSPIASLYRHTNVTCQIWAALQTKNYRLFLNWSSGVRSIFYPRHSFHSLSHTHTHILQNVVSLTLQLGIFETITTRQLPPISMCRLTSR